MKRQEGSWQEVDRACNRTEIDFKGSGYVVKSLQAANLGDDADTTAVICGQIAGAFYGEANIPVKWLERLFMRVEIRNVANQLTGFFS